MNALAKFSGYPIIQSSSLMPDYTVIKLPAISKHRSKRLMKKLMQGMRRNAYSCWTSVIMMVDSFDGQTKIICHPTVYQELKSYAKEANTQVLS